MILKPKNGYTICIPKQMLRKHAFNKLYDCKLIWLRPNSVAVPDKNVATVRWTSESSDVALSAHDPKCDSSFLSHSRTVTGQESGLISKYLRFAISLVRWRIVLQSLRECWAWGTLSTLHPLCSSRRCNSWEKNSCDWPATKSIARLSLVLKITK